MTGPSSSPASTAASLPFSTCRRRRSGAHLAARGTFTEAFGVTQPEPAPRMSRTPGRIQSGPTEPGADSVDVLRAWGFDTADIDRLIADGVVRQPESSH